MWVQVESVLHESLARILTKVATLLPAVLAIFAAMLIFCVMGALCATILRRLLRAARFDDRLRSGEPSLILDWTAVRSPSLLLSRIVFWCFAVAGVMIGVTVFAAAFGDSAQLATTLFPYVLRTASAVLLFLIGMVAARFLERTVLIGAVNMNLHSARLLSQGIRWLIVVFAIAMALDHLGVGGAIVELAFGILFGGIVLTLALAIGLGSPELIARTLEQGSAGRSDENATQKVHHF